MSVSFITGAVCAMCSGGVHDEDGRVACDGCDLPTDCCLCAPVQAEAPEPPRAVHALGPGRWSRRLAEHVLSNGCIPAPFAPAETAMPGAALRGVPVVAADVAALYAAALRRRRATIGVLDLPDVRPPHERCFVEMRAADGGGRQWGAYLATFDLAAPKVLSRVKRDPRLRPHRRTLAKARWLVLSGLVVENPDAEPMGPVLLHQVCLDEAGRIVPAPGGELAAWLAASLPGRKDGREEGDDDRFFKAACTARYFVPVLLALALARSEDARLVPEDGAGVPLERLRLPPFEGAVARAARPGDTTVDVAAAFVPGRFLDGRAAPGGTIRWEPAGASGG